MKKTALITGATMGIGYELSLLFAEDSYDLILIARDELTLRKMRSDFLLVYEIDIHIIAIDLSRSTAAREIFDTIRTLNLEVDVLINNAGIGDYGYFSDQTLTAINKVMKVNIIAPVELTRLFVTGMIERGNGKILNISSLAAFVPGPKMSVYYASKTFLLSFSEALACELNGTGVTISVLCPGPTKTGFQAAVGSENSILSRFNLLSSPDAVARQAYKDFFAEKKIITPGLINNSIRYISGILSNKQLAKIVFKLQKLNRPEVGIKLNAHK
ncbi:MAG: SDR family NAD(P)-dependent oxidoreductase [Bacteroidales bacterium]